MLFATHILIGISFYLLFTATNILPNSFLLFLLTLFGSILPDIDEKHSKINRAAGFVGQIIAYFAKHRGFFHSIFFQFLVAIILIYFTKPIYALAIFVGYLAHITGDSLTPMGIQMFYPLSDYKFNGPIRTGSLSEKVLMIILVAVIAYVLFN